MCVWELSPSLPLTHLRLRSVPFASDAVEVHAAHSPWEKQSTTTEVKFGIVGGRETSGFEMCLSVCLSVRDLEVFVTQKWPAQRR